MIRIPRVTINARDRGQRGHLWVYVGDGEHVFVDFTPDWSGDGPQAILMQRRGYIQADGYAGYDALLGPGSPRTEIACWMHARRGFEKALQAGDARGGTILALVQKLYAVERTAKQDGALPDQRLVHRLEHSLPVYEEIFHLLDLWAPQVEPKTPLGEAITYARNRRLQLGRFFGMRFTEPCSGDVARRPGSARDDHDLSPASSAARSSCSCRAARRERRWGRTRR